MRLRKYLITEKTFSISRDVEKIYNEYFKDFYDDLKKIIDEDDYEKSLKIVRQSKYSEVFNDIYQSNKGWILFGTFDGKNLTSSDAKKAYLINPVDIRCGIFYDGSWYRAKEVMTKVQKEKKEKSLIQVSPSIFALQSVLNTKFSNLELPQRQKEILPEEAKSVQIKTTISHELSHWISDSVYNRHLEKLLDKTFELQKSEILLLGKKDVNMTYFEIDAQIHALKQLKMAYRKKWDDLTFNELFDLKPNFWQIYSDMYKYGRDIARIWMKALTKRMNREKLLGKNMRKYPSISRSPF